MQAILAMKGGTMTAPNWTMMQPQQHQMMMSAPSQMPPPTPRPTPRPTGRPPKGSDEAKEQMARVRAAQVKKYVTKEKNEEEWPDKKKTRIDDSDARAALSARRNSKGK